MDFEKFVDDCVRANRGADAQAAVQDVLASAVSDPGAVLKAIGEPKRAGIDVLHRSPELTIFNATWTPHMSLMPHNHLMWALIGLYTGREDNIIWRDDGNGMAAHEAKCLFAGDCAALPVDVVHSVTNPLPRFTGGIHIYGGDFFDMPRHQWDAETLDVKPADGSIIKAMFERENERLGL
jgi:predicted metal-dependent enzyme (double-stranded beta helix superfamily)